MNQYAKSVIDVRVDKWLWAARFYKTRALAIEAINGGKVHLNGHRVKPSKKLLIGDMLTLSLAQSELEVEVMLLADKRGPASFAQTLYTETPKSIKKRELRAEQNLGQVHSQHKPNKKDRRDLRRLKGY